MSRRSCCIGVRTYAFLRLAMLIKQSSPLPKSQIAAGIGTTEETGVRPVIVVAHRAVIYVFIIDFRTGGSAMSIQVN